MGNPKQVDFGGSDIVTNNVRIGVTKAGGSTATVPAILSGTVAPAGAVSAPHGSLYIHRGGTAANTRLFINSTGVGAAGTTWAAVTSA